MEKQSKGLEKLEAKLILFTDTITTQKSKYCGYYWLHSSNILSSQ